MKAILVIDMPTNCNECTLLNYEYGCPIIGATGDRSKGRSVVCPLKPMPAKNYWDKKDFADGWNACLEEIEK